jgi:hypothetical protein
MRAREAHSLYIRCSPDMYALSIPDKYGNNLIVVQANIVKHDPREETTVKIERVLTSDLRPVSRSARDFIERSRTAQVILKLVGVFGVSLIMSGLYLIIFCPLGQLLTMAMKMAC